MVLPHLNLILILIILTYFNLVLITIYHLVVITNQSFILFIKVSMNLS